MNLSLHRKAKRATRGFTIIEIMIAMVIFGMIVAAIFATWSALVHGSVAGNRAAATAQRSRMAMRTLEDSLGSALSYVADVQYYTFDAENGSEPYLSFVSKLSPSFPRSGRWPDSEVRRVTFSVEKGDNYSKRLVLRQAPVLMDMDEDEQNYPVVLANDVKKFEMEFWDKQKGDWLDEWTQTNQIPQMVKFTMQMNNEPVELTRIVSLPSVAVQSMWQIPGSTLGGPGFRSGNNQSGGFRLPSPR
jgi:general secretion pathway protein J